jgi:phosphoserine phosphatase
MKWNIWHLALVIVLLIQPCLLAVPASEETSRQQVEKYLRQQGLEIPGQPPFGFKSWQAYLDFLHEELEPRCQDKTLMECGQIVYKDPPWSESVKTDLEQFFTTDLKGQVVVFDTDGTLWRHNAELDFIFWLVNNSRIKPKPKPFLTPWDEYDGLSRRSHQESALFAARILTSVPESEVRELAKAYFKAQLKPHIYTAQSRLIKRLLDAGAEVWLVSSLNQWLAEEVAIHFGIPATQVIGTRLEVIDGNVTHTLIPPVPSQQGKVEAIRKYIGKIPLMAVGDGADDIEMLSFASQLRLVIYPEISSDYPYLINVPTAVSRFEQKPLYEHALAKKWLIQIW